MRWRSGSMLTIRTSTSSLTCTTSSGVPGPMISISLEWIRPSIPSGRVTKAPKLTTFETVPSTRSPSLYFSSISSHGLGCSALRLRLMRSRSTSTSLTLTSTSSPTLTTVEGSSTLSQLSSDLWISPSTPSSATKAPKSVRFTTVPVTTEPSSSSSRRRMRRSFSAARADRISRFRLRSTSMTFSSIVSPTISFFVSFRSVEDCIRRAFGRCEFGTKPSR